MAKNADKKDNTFKIKLFGVEFRFLFHKLLKHRNNQVIFTKNFIYTALINFFVSAAYYMLFVISVPYAVNKFQVSSSLGGFAAGLILIGCLCGRLISGRIILIFGFKKLIFTGLVIYILSLASYLAADNLYFFMAVRFINGIGIGCIGTVTSVLIVYIIPKELHGRGINYFSLSAVMAMAIGPFLAIYMMAHASFHAIFVFCLIVGAVSFIFAVFISYPCVHAPQNTKSSFHLSHYICYAVVPITVVILFVAAGYGSLQAFLPIYAEEVGLTKTAGAFFLIYAAAAFVSRPFTGKTFDQKGANIIIYPSLVLGAVGFMLLCLSKTPSLMILSALFLGLGIANFQTAIQAVCVKLAKSGFVSQAVSTYFIFMDLGIGMGPYLYGLLTPRIGFDGLFATAAAVTFGCIFLYYFIYGKKAAAV
ncbi:MAG: MFS transporter [Campylobacteraceae bacterium]|jgi:MFS family permease|nr:MFS transporter [Campylobacteraceae bacterium]